MAVTSWKETSRHVYEQPLGLVESFYNVIKSPEGQPGHWIIATAVKFTYTRRNSAALPSLLRQACVEVRRQEPGIAASGDVAKGVKRYEEVSEREMSEWSESFLQIHKCMTANGFLEKSICSRRTASLHYFSRSSELLLHVEHDLLDGRGSLLFFRKLFDALVQPSSTSSAVDAAACLPPRQDDILNYPSTAPPDTYAICGQLLSAMAPTNESICMPVANMAAVPSNTTRCELKLPARTTSAIISACKSRNISVTSAWHAAMILATKAIQADATCHSGTTFVSFSNFDLRQFFPEVARKWSEALACYHTALPAIIETGGASFDEVAAQLSRFYKTAFREGEFFAFRNMTAYGSIAIEATKAGLPPSSTPIVSSLGILDDILAKSCGTQWHIEDVWVADTMLTPEIEAFLWTWNGRLTMSPSFNAAYYTHEEVQRWLEKIADLLVLGLEIDDRDG